jgi:uncharacterized membrane protein
VVVQGALGGLRVILDDKTIAKVHACTGPLFFAVATAVTVLTRRRDGQRWSSADQPQAAPGSAPLPLPSWGVGSFVPTALVIAAYLQLVAGAQLRHADATFPPSTFRWMVALHLVGAAAVTVLAGLAVVAWQPHESPVARRWSRGILVMVFGQLLLGAGAWLFSWGMPAWLQDAWAPTEAVLARSPRGAAVITGPLCCPNWSHYVIVDALFGTAGLEGNVFVNDAMRVPATTSIYARLGPEALRRLEGVSPVSVSRSARSPSASAWSTFVESALDSKRGTAFVDVQRG